MALNCTPSWISACVPTDELHLAALRCARRPCGAARRVSWLVSSAVVDAERLGEAADGGEVLLGQQLGRRHERRLVAVLDRHQRREQRDDRLAAADVALHQPMQRMRLRHVGEDLAR